ncbi:ABC transporter permease [Insolitispirillum peregrinum]|uniref:ABC transporter permease n=1 Tax=Insolitispirillum peregrinum TaxID=80876 RepID=UPI00360B17A9
MTSASPPPIPRRPLLRPGMGKLAPGFFLFLCLFLAPVLIVVVYSLLTRGTYGGVVWQIDLDSYARVLGLPNEDELRDRDFVYLGIFAKSAMVAAATAGLTLLMAFPAAWYIARQPDRRKFMLLTLVTLPFFVNALVRVYAWMLILRADGLINNLLMAGGLIDQPLHLIYTPGAVVVAMVYQYLPFMVLPLFASLEKMDLRLLEASRDLGASGSTTFRRVVLPLAMPGIVAGMVLVFVPAFGNFLAPTLIGGAKDLQLGPLLAQAFLSARDWPFGSAIATLLSAVVLLCLFVMARSEGRQTKEVV